MNAPMGDVPMSSPRSLFAHGVETGAGFGVPDVVRILFKRKWTILVTFVAVTLIVVWGVSRLPPTYIVTGKVLVKLDESGSPSFFSGIAAYRDSLTDEPANRRIENEMEMAETWPVAAAVVRKLGLTYDEVYQSPLHHLIRPAGDAYDWVAANLLGLKPDPEKRGFADTVELMAKSYDVKPVVSKSTDTNSNMIAFALQGIDPERARRSLEAVIDTYIGQAGAARQAEARKALEIVSRRTADMRAEVATAQARLEAYLGTSSLGRDASSAPTTAVTTDAPTGPRDVSTPRDVTTLSQLKARLVDLQVQLVEQQHNVRGPNDRTAALQASIAALMDQMQREQLRSARDESAVAALERDLRMKEAELLDLEKRMSQIGMFVEMGASQLSNRVVVEPPLAPRSSEWKKRLVIVIVGALGGLFLGLMLAGLREFADHRMEAEADVVNALGLPVLGVIPMARGAALRRSLDGAGLLARLGVGAAARDAVGRSVGRVHARAD